MSWRAALRAWWYEFRMALAPEDVHELRARVEAMEARMARAVGRCIPPPPPVDSFAEMTARHRAIVDRLREHVDEVQRREWARMKPVRQRGMRPPGQPVAIVKKGIG